jgi:hypothetical protein
MKIPPTATPEMQQALREVWDAINRTSGAQNVDMHGRSFLNAGKAVAGPEYVTKLQLDTAIDDLALLVTSAGPTLTLPDVPNTPFPATAATGVSRTPTVTWVAASATSYDVYWGRRLPVTRPAR